jgi:hypothetical protein
MDLEGARQIRLTLYIILVSAQSLALCLWCLSSCSQEIASGRNLKTFDFLRTTRLTSGDLVFGMVYGVPVMAYFIVACTLPFTLVLGLSAGIPLSALALTYLMLLLVAAVLSLASLTISMMTDRPRAGEVLLLLLFFGWPAMAFSIAVSGDSRFPGMSAVSVVMGLLPYYPGSSAIHGAERFSQVPFFGYEVPSLLVSVILYGTAAAWLLLILVRNLKKDREDIRLLSRWQAVGFTVYVNLLAFALLDLRPLYSPYVNRIEPISALDVEVGYLALNLLILYAVGLATLTPPSRLKSWWLASARGIRLYWSVDGPPWPWMIACAMAAFLLFILEAFLSTRYVPFAEWSFSSVAWRLFVLLIFATRDILFIQWWALRGVSRYILKGALYVLLYYATAFIVGGFFFHTILGWLTPLGVFAGRDLVSPLSVVVGAVVQSAACAFLLLAIRRHLTPTSSAPSISAPYISGIS